MMTEEKINISFIIYLFSKIILLKKRERETHFMLRNQEVYIRILLVNIDNKNNNTSKSKKLHYY